MNDADVPTCGHAGCRRDADYRVEVPGAAPALRCRWHADELWRPHGAAARVVALDAEVPEIDTSRARRGTVGPAVVLAIFVVVVAVGFAVLAPIML